MNTCLTFTHFDAPHVRLCLFWDETKEEVGVVTIRRTVPTFEYLPPAIVARQFSLTAEEMQALTGITEVENNVIPIRSSLDTLSADMVLDAAKSQFEDVAVVGVDPSGLAVVSASGGLSSDAAIGVLFRGAHEISALGREQEDE